MTDRIQWLDGLRGLSCIMIYTAHFLLGFFPAIQYGSPSHGFLSWDQKLSTAPVRCLTEGRFWVVLFCLISGYVLCIQIVRSKEKLHPAALVLKRYFRLVPPVFLVSLVVWGMLALSLFSHFNAAEITGSPWLTTSYVGPVPLADVFKESLLLVWLEPHVAFSNAFWVLPVFFLGAFLAYGVGILARFGEKRYLSVRVLIGLGAALLLFFQQYFYLSVLIGAVLAAETYKKGREEEPAKAVIGILLIAAGIVIASIPTEFCLPNSSVYSAAASFLGRFTGNVFDLSYFLGGFLVFYGIFLCRPLKNLLSRRLFQWLNGVSYAVYLIHIPLLFSFSCFLFRGLYDAMGNYQLTALLVYIVSLALLLVLARLFHRFLEKPVYGCLRKLVNKIWKN